MNVRFDRHVRLRGDVKTSAASQSEWEKKVILPTTCIKDLYCFPHHFCIMMPPSKSRYTRMYVFSLCWILYFSYPLPQALVGCLRYELKLGAVINCFFTLSNRISLSLRYKGGMASKSYAFL